MLLPLKHNFSFGLRRDAHDPAFARQRTGHVKISGAIERQTLWTPQPAEKCAHFSGGIDAVHAVETGSGRAGNVKLVGGAERQMVSRK